MRIEHVAMYVNDLKAAKNFFEKYLGASANEGYHNCLLYTSDAADE